MKTFLSGLFICSTLLTFSQIDVSESHDEPVSKMELKEKESARVIYLEVARGFMHTNDTVLSKLTSKSTFNFTGADFLFGNKKNHFVHPLFGMEYSGRNVGKVEEESYPTLSGPSGAYIRILQSRMGIRSYFTKASEKQVNVFADISWTHGINTTSFHYKSIYNGLDIRIGVEKEIRKDRLYFMCSVGYQSNWQNGNTVFKYGYRNMDRMNFSVAIGF